MIPRRTVQSSALISVLVVTLAALGTPFAASGSGAGVLNVPPALLDAPSAQAIGLWANTGSITAVGPDPVAEAHSSGGRTAEVTGFAHLFLKTVDGTSTLADVKVADTVAVANASAYANMARAHVNILAASLLDGKVTARLLTPHVFTSGGVRFETMDSRIAQVSVLGVDVSVQGSNIVVPIPAVGSLTINETHVDPATGSVSVYALHLHLLTSVDIIVGSAQAMSVTGHGLGGPCITWSNAYPAGMQGVVLSDLLSVKANHVMGDVLGNGTGSARVNIVPLDKAAPLVLLVDGASASHASVVLRDGPTGYGEATTEVRSELLGVNLLNGLITADVVRAIAMASSANTTANLSDVGTLLVGLKVSGTYVNDTPAPNTVNVTLTASGKTVGYVLVNEQTREIEVTGNHSSVAVLRINLIHVVLTTNDLGFRIGTNIVLGHAIAHAQCGGPLYYEGFGDPLGIRPTPW